jgi:hypothetical protein
MDEAYSDQFVKDFKATKMSVIIDYKKKKKKKKVSKLL